MGNGRPLKPREMGIESRSIAHFAFAGPRHSVALTLFTRKTQQKALGQRRHFVFQQR